MTAPLIDLRRLVFRYEPFPVGLVKSVIEPELYEVLSRDFPPIEMFAYTPNQRHKYSLSEKNNPKAYHDFVNSRVHWREMHRWLKSRDFIEYVLSMLEEGHINLGLPCANASRTHVVFKSLLALLRGKSPSAVERLRTRFEFSALPAEGGFIRPHTDTPKKRITLIISMATAEEWRSDYGGGTEINRPLRQTDSYNWKNESLEFEDVEVIDSYPFLPNQCVLFVKTFNSLHSVAPMRGKGSEALRRTLTINLEIEH